MTTTSHLLGIDPVVMVREKDWENNAVRDAAATILNNRKLAEAEAARAAQAARG